MVYNKYYLVTLILICIAGKCCFKREIDCRRPETSNFSSYQCRQKLCIDCTFDFTTKCEEQMTCRAQDNIDIDVRTASECATNHVTSLSDQLKARHDLDKENKSMC